MIKREDKKVKLLHGKNIVWVTRSFLDYRVPVFTELNKLLEGRLTVIYSKEFTPERAWKKLESAIGPAAIGLTGERSFGYKGNITGEMANSRLRVPYQPGLLKSIRESRPDVLIGDGFFQWTWAALLHRIKSGIPLVVCYERTKHTERYAQWYRILFRKCMIKFIAAMSVNGRLSKEYVEALGMSSSAITTGHMVADTETLASHVRTLKLDERHKLQVDFHLSDYRRVFLSVCQLIERKGILNLLLAWQQYQATGHKNSVLLLVGDGPEREKLEQLCQEKKIEGVKFVGAVDYDNIHKYFALSDVFVISTLEDNWSLVVPEAMACGKPVLCSKYNGCWPELINEGENGWVFDPKNIQSTRTALQQCADCDKLPQMGEISRQIISGHTAKHAAKAVLCACEIATQKRH